MRSAKNDRIKYAMAYLDENGWVGRTPIMSKFRVSLVTATLDLRDAERLYPGRMVYDGKTKRYLPAANAGTKE